MYWFGCEGAGTALTILVAAILMLIRFAERRPSALTDKGEGERRSRTRPPTERDINRTPSRVPGSVQHQRQTIESRRASADTQSKSCDGATQPRAPKSSSDGTDCRSKRHDEVDGRVAKSIDDSASVRDLQHTVSARRLRQMSEDELNCGQNGWDTIMKCREQPSDMSILKEAKIINHVVRRSETLGIKTSTSSRLSSMGRREKMSSADAISLTSLGDRTRSPPKVSLSWGPVFGAYDSPPAGRPRTWSWLAMKERHLVNQKLRLGEMGAQGLAEYPFISLSNSTSRKVPSENVQCGARFI